MVDAESIAVYKGKDTKDRQNVGCRHCETKDQKNSPQMCRHGLVCVCVIVYVDCVIEYM